MNRVHDLGVKDYVSISGYSQQQLAVSATSAYTAQKIEAGVYAVWCDDGELWFKTEDTNTTAVTSDNGMKLKEGAMENVFLPIDLYIGAIASGNATLRYHRIA